MISWNRALLLPATAAALAVLAACGSAPAAAPPAPAAAPADPHAGMDMNGMQGMEGMDMGGGGVELWAVQTGPLGVIVTDGSGMLIYRSDKDTNAPSATSCTGDCVKTWEPLLAIPNQAPSLLGVKETAVSTIARDDGSQQLTLAGWPLYRHRGDQAGLQNTAAVGTDGVWFAIRPDGEKAAPAS